jgi:hypothetical protein
MRIPCNCRWFILPWGGGKSEDNLEKERPKSDGTLAIRRERGETLADFAQRKPVLQDTQFLKFVY